MNFYVGPDFNSLTHTVFAAFFPAGTFLCEIVNSESFDPRVKVSFQNQIPGAPDVSLNQ